MIFKITEIKEYLNGVLVSFLANKKVENILINFTLEKKISPPLAEQECDE